MNNTLQKVILITSGQPSLNPRLVKEADALFNAGYKVTVIYQYWNDWGTEMDKGLLAKKKWKANRVGGSPDQAIFIYWLSRVMYKTGQILSRFFGRKYGLAEIAIGRCTPLLIRAACKYHADLYIAHNLAALPAAVKAAKKNGAKCGFDAEDFHRNEVNDNSDDADVILKTFIESKYIPQVDYLSAGSPSIAAAYQQLFTNKAPVSILNVFPVDKRIKSPLPIVNRPVKLFWFSQTIGSNRGLEDIIKAMHQFKPSVFELHILGFLPAGGKQYITYLAGHFIDIHFYTPIPGDDIAVFASQFDIGLALENNTPYNRNICLTNKIFTYLQASLAIIASDTKAQKDFINTYPEIGITYTKGNVPSLIDALNTYLEDPELLINTKKNAYTLSRDHLNWDKEQKIFLNLIKGALNNDAEDLQDWT